MIYEPFSMFVEFLWRAKAQDGLRSVEIYIASVRLPFRAHLLKQSVVLWKGMQHELTSICLGKQS